MTCYLLHSYLPALLATLAIETAVAVLLGFRKRLQILAVNLATLVTHPVLHGVVLAVFFLEWLPSPLPFQVVLGLEACVFLAEGALLAYALRLPLWRAGLLSLIMNLASFLVGVFVR
mgnify:CR=1 FL=1